MKLLKKKKWKTPCVCVLVCSGGGDFVRKVEPFIYFLLINSI